MYDVLKVAALFAACYGLVFLADRACAALLKMFRA